MTSLLALALATTIGGTLLSLLSAPGKYNTATEPNPDPDDAVETPTVLAHAAVGGAAPPSGPDLAPSIPVPPAPVPSFPAPPLLVPPAPVVPTPATSEPPDLAGTDPAASPLAPLTHAPPHPRSMIRRPPTVSWERHPFAAAGKLILFVAALGASGAIVVAAGVALLARSLR